MDDELFVKLDREAGPQTPDEAVEAVMRDLGGRITDRGQPFFQDELDGGRAAVRHILAVALPLLAPKPLLDRAAVDAALIANADSITRQGGAVMELARPMPTREQLRRAIQDELLERGAGGVADVVLELLNGTES